MSNTVTGSAKGSVSFAEIFASGILAGDQIPLTESWRSVFATSGALADQCNKIYAATLSFTGTTPQTLDLSSLTDMAGVSIDFTNGGAGGGIRLVAFRNQNATDTDGVAVGAAASNPWTGFLGSTSVLTIPASSAANDGWFIITAPNTAGMVVGSTSKSLKFVPAATGLLDVILAGF